MLIVTAGDRRFSQLVARSRERAEQLGYRFLAYDLGGLELDAACRRELAAGELSTADLQQLRARGYYEELSGGWLTRALHKPAVIADCLAATDGFVTYLDGDACLLSRIDEVAVGDYDLGLVLRPCGETTGAPLLSGVVNAGVIFLPNTARTRGFVRRWRERTLALRNDQLALNDLLFAGREVWRQLYGVWVYLPLDLPAELEVDGLRVRLFDPRYNCSLSPLPDDAKIAHFKGEARAHAPAGGDAKSSA